MVGGEGKCSWLTEGGRKSIEESKGWRSRWSGDVLNGQMMRMASSRLICLLSRGPVQRHSPPVTCAYRRYSPILILTSVPTRIGIHNISDIGREASSKITSGLLVLSRSTRVNTLNLAKANRIRQVLRGRRVSTNVHSSTWARRRVQAAFTLAALRLRVLSSEGRAAVRVAHNWRLLIVSTRSFDASANRS